jgi:hypothetical protein
MPSANRSPVSRRPGAGAIPPLLLLLALAPAACEGREPDAPVEPLRGGLTATEDALAEAYGVFKALFTCAPGSTVCADAGIGIEQDKTYVIGFGFHPGLSTTKILFNGAPVSGQATIDFPNGNVTAVLQGPTSGPLFDLYFVKNAVGAGTVKPEPVDQIFKVGQFAPDPAVPGQHRLSVHVGTAPFPQKGVNFDLDLVVVTLRGKSPTSNVVAVGARTLFEKRFFRERAGATLDPVTGTRANFVETDDPLVQRGAQLFANEGFGGNGRRCVTCHPLANNQTIDPAFVAGLPPSDPLFHFPAGLEDSGMLPHALIRENVDGFDQPTKRFVERGVPHTLSLSTSIGVVGTGVGANDGNESEAGISSFPPPDQRTGWSGDGAPGRGTLQEFAFGAIVQHYTLSLARVPGTDFRIPTQGELDALEAFQLFGGRQRTADVRKLTFGDSAADAGKSSATGEGVCLACHVDLFGVQSINNNFDTGVENLPIPFRTATNMPKDGGFGLRHADGSPGSIATGFGNGTFNAPPLAEAADTPPFFHNGAVSVIEDAVAFYQSPQFLSSPATIFAVPSLTPESIQNIGAFLRSLNALVNIVQVRRRAVYLQTHATTGGTAIMNLAIKDTQDALDDLGAPALAGAATQDARIALLNVKAILENTLPFANQQPSTEMIQVLTWLGLARGDLLTGNPDNEF